MKEIENHKQNKLRMPCIGDKLCYGYAYRFKGELVLWDDKIDRGTNKRTECVYGLRVKDRSL